MTGLWLRATSFWPDRPALVIFGCALEQRLVPHHTYRSSTPHVRILATWVLALFAAAPLAGQAVTGRVIDVDGDTAVAGVAVSLADSTGRLRMTVLTDTAGAFVLPVTTPGRYTLRTQHIAFQPIVTRPFTVAPGENVDVELRLSRAAIALEPLVVRTRRKVGVAYLRNYYDRLEENQRMARGRILTREDLEPLRGLAVKEAMRRQMTTFMSRGFPCTPTYYWNGMRIDEEAIVNTPVSNVEGIEIYRRHDAPPPYGGCAVVLVWSRPIRPGEGHPHNWVIMAAGLGLFALLTLAFH
ncbi:MAG: carboxypeptidase-like regulatory domain-containing protein [Gemmatimonadota bacterium]